MAKILFSASVSGMYAIASILAKTIFLGTQPISKVMFPLSVENKSLKKGSTNILKTSLFIIFAPILAVLVLFYIFPESIVRLFSGKSIPEISVILFLLGIGNSILSVTNLLLLYKLSLGRTRRYYLVFLFVVIELLLLIYFSGSILEFAIAFVLSSSAFLLGSLLMIGE